MKQIKKKIRNFRVTDEMDGRLLAAAARVDMEPSRLLRDLVTHGSALILGDAGCAGITESKESTQ